MMHHKSFRDIAILRCPNMNRTQYPSAWFLYLDICPQSTTFFIRSNPYRSNVKMSSWLVSFFEFCFRAKMSASFPCAPGVLTFFELPCCYTIVFSPGVITFLGTESYKSLTRFSSAKPLFALFTYPLRHSLSLTNCCILSTTGSGISVFFFSLYHLQEQEGRQPKVVV